MAIQIEEKLLSAKAREALNNAKSKSKLLRDALEAYVRNDSFQDVSNNMNTVEDSEIKQDIKDIKNMLQKLTVEGRATGETKHYEQIFGIERGEMNRNDALKEDKQINTAKNDALVPQESKRVESKDAVAPVETARESVYMSEERKKQIEAMYDASLENFGE